MDGSGPQSVMIGKYRLLAELGHGGMAQVYLAVASGVAGFNKLVVIKLIRAELAEDPDFVRMFLQEARLAARLNHPNVVQTNEVDHDGSRYFICMEYLEGQTLGRVLNRMGREPALLPLGHQLRLVADALAGLHYAHELRDFDGATLGMVHRDISPQNIFVTYAGQVKVVDFGIAKARHSIVQTQVGELKGKPAYMAPEQARGEPVDRRADVFSVGMILWQIATGQRPYWDLPDAAVIPRISRGEIPALGAEAEAIPPRLRQIIEKAIAPRPEQRHGSAAELQADIEAFLEESGSRASCREIGGMVGEHFARERARIQAIIEQQLGKEVLDGQEIVLPSITADRSSETGRSMSSVSDEPTIPEGRTAAAAAPPAGDTASVGYAGSIGRGRDKLGRGPLWIAAAGAVALGGALAALAFWPRSPEPSRPGSSAPSRAPSAATSAGSAATAPAGTASPAAASASAAPAVPASAAKQPPRSVRPASKPPPAATTTGGPLDIRTKR
ncbi:MAG: serine/threonine protein kinase [Deltaproteobacteria bacterium]|nr:serine/threonine protein kinase [Deltaproteobacteria bacterium]